MQLTVTDSQNTKQLQDGIIELTDANGKKLTVKADDIVDASTIMANDKAMIQDNNSSITNFAVAISDSEGNVIDEENLIADVKSGAATALDVTFEATHSGGNKNSTVYSSDSMVEDTKSWQYPFAKPLIKNHDMYEEPIGRVIDALFAQSEFDNNRDTINVTFRVSDSDAMQKFADGRYKTMSIGAKAGHIQCNVCGKDILKDNKFKFCGHWRGETYANNTATWTVKNLEYKEGSVVNNPADVLAQVKKIRVIKAKEGSSMTNSTNNKDSELDSLLDNIDDLTSTNSVVNDNEPTGDENNNPVDPTVADANTGEDDNNEPEVNTNAGEGEQTDELAEANKKLEEANTKIADLEKSLEEATKSSDELKEELTAKDAEIKTLKDEATSNEESVNTLKDQAKRLATLNKQLLVDNLKALKSDITDEEIADKTAKEIYKMISDAKVAPRVIPTVQNPGAAIIDNNTIVEDGEEAPVENTKSMKDMEEVLFDIFTRQE